MSDSLTPIIVLAHGSRHPAADEAVRSVAFSTQTLSHRPTFAAHLDFSPATLENVAHMVKASGHEAAVVVPLLFTKAFHMRYDVPAALERASRSAGIRLYLADGLGTGEDMAELLAQAHRDASAGARELVLYSVGSTVPGANTAVADLAARVASRLGIPRCRAVHATGKGEGRGPRAVLDERGRPLCDRYILPLFVSPATLWDKLTAFGPWAGDPLGDAVAPIVLSRAEAARATSVCTQTTCSDFPRSASAHSQARSLISL